MRGQQLQHRQTPIQSVQALRQSHIKVRVPIGWRLVLPLAAMAMMFALNGCANSSQKYASKEVKGMGETALVSGKTPKHDTEPKDTLRLKPVKVQNEFTGPISKRDSLLKARIEYLQEHMPGRDWPLPDRDHPRNLTPEQKKEITRELRYITLEGAMCSSALKGDKAAIDGYIKELLEFATSIGEERRAEQIIKNFNNIMSSK